jgi:ribosomal protein L37AE/L43A
MEVFMSSPSLCPEVRTFLHERLDALLDDCTHVGNNATYGRYIHDLDDFLYIEGRKFMREVLEKQVQERIQQVEVTDEGKQCPQCKKKRLPTPDPVDR